jgi:3-hydroxy-3-methylglutaryl CoA synthase
MAAITSCNVYIPVWRLERGEITKATGFQSLGGERSVACWDEDTITMAVEAASGIVDADSIDALIFASTSSPFKVKQAASLVATALDLKPDIFTADVTDTFRASTNALIMASEMVDSGKYKKILVIASEKIPVKPSTLYEQLFGDGAVALTVEKGSDGSDGEGDEGEVEILGYSSYSKPQPGAWMKAYDDSMKDFDMRVDARFGYAANLQAAVMPLFAKMGLMPADIDRLVISAPDPKSYVGLLKSVGVKPEEFFFDKVGILGTAHPFLLLAHHLAKEGKIILGSYGEGSDAFLIDVKSPLKSNLEKMVKSKKKIDYGEYLYFREKIGERSYPDSPSPVKYWRDKKSILRFYGMKCKNCGIISYPIGRCCIECGAKDNYEEVRLSEKGRIYTYTIDNLLSPGNYNADGVHPHVVAVVDFEGGGRVFMEVTDIYRGKEEIDVDMEVERTFRFLNEKNGFRYYYWKVRKPR